MKKVSNRNLYLLAGCLLLVLLISCLSPFFLGDSITKVHLENALQAPNSQEWFGTDAVGRSVFARTLSGGIQTIVPAVGILLLVTLVGSFIGVTSALIGGKFDRAVFLFITAFQSLPSIVLVIAIVSLLGVGLQQTVIAIGITAWTKYAYITRSLTLRLKNEFYVQSAKMYGNSFWKTLKNYYVPSLFPQIVTTMTFNVSTIIMEIAGLSFVGLGAQAPSPEWGAMMNDGRTYIQEAPWIVAFPCIFLIGIILLVTKFGDALHTSVNKNNQS